MLQYIGARYVPIFYQNSLDPTSSEWENNVTYEPMTWVSLPNGHMYISKKEVPTTVGTPASNPDYWLEAGQFNGYIQALQDQIDDIKDGTIPGSIQNQINTIDTTLTNIQDGTVPGSLQAQIDDVDDKIGNLSNLNTIDKSSVVNAINETNREFNKVILISDSYGSYGSTPFLQQIAEHLDLANSDYIATYEGSSGFVHAGLSGHKFIDLLQAVTAFTSSEVSHIIVLGGLNDVGESSATIQTAIGTFITYARTNYPNAEVLIGFVGNVRDATKVRNLGITVVDQAVAVSRFDHARVLPKLECVLKNNNYMNADGVHPNNDGVDVLAHYCAEAIRGREINPTYYKQINRTQGGVDFAFWQGISNGVFTMWTNNMRIYDFATPQTWAPSDTKNFFDVATDSLCLGSYYQDLAQEMPITVVNNGTQFKFTAAVIFYNGLLQIRPLESFTTLTNVTRVYFPQFLLSMDAKYC